MTAEFAHMFSLLLAANNKRRVGTVGSLIYTKILLKSVCLSVCVSKLQVAILARSPQEMSQIVRID